MKNRNTNNNSHNSSIQIEFALPATAFFHVRRRSALRPKRRLPLHRSRFWFQRMHAIIDSIPDPVPAITDH